MHRLPHGAPPAEAPPSASPPRGAFLQRSLPRAIDQSFSCRHGQSRAFYQFRHLPYGPVKPDKHRPRDYGVAYIELLDPSQRHDFPDVGVVQAVTGINPEAEFGGQLHRISDLRQFRLRRLPPSRLSISAGMDLHVVRTDLIRSL